MLDTNHCSRILADDGHATQRLAALGDALVATNVSVRGELMFMAEHSAQREINLQRIEAFLATLDVYSVDDATADWYGTLKAAPIAYLMTVAALATDRSLSLLHRIRYDPYRIGDDLIKHHSR